MSLKRTFGKYTQSVGALWATGIMMTVGTPIGVSKMVNHDLDGDLSVVASAETDAFKKRIETLDPHKGELDGLLADLLTSPHVNERTYTQFAKALAPVAEASYVVSYTDRGKSLNECRSSKGENIMASKLEVADDIANCMVDNEAKTFSFTFMSILLSFFLLSIILVELNGSSKMRQWSQLPKNKKPKPN